MCFFYSFKNILSLLDFKCYEFEVVACLTVSCFALQSAFDFSIGSSCNLLIVYSKLMSTRLYVHTYICVTRHTGFVIHYFNCCTCGTHCIL